MTTPCAHDARPLHMQYSGTLIHGAEVRSRPCDSAGHMVPVLCFDIVSASATHNLVHVEQPFPAGAQDQCEVAARRLKKGMHVTVEHAAMGLRVIAPNTLHVHVHQPEQLPS